MLPNFLHIGVSKGASTWLYQACLEHPDIFVPLKNDNVNFFLVHYHLGLEWYQSQYFAEARDERAIGEFSNSYLVTDVPLERLARDLPEVRLSVMLRHPVERAYLNWAHAYYKSGGWRSTDPSTDSGDPLEIMGERPQGRLFGIPLETIMHPNGWSYCWKFLQPGLYAAHLRRIQQRIPPERLKILLYDDLCADPQEFIRDYYAWLGVDADFEPPCAQRRINPDTAEADIAELTPELRQHMHAFFRQDIEELERLLGRDLSAWKEQP